jgi:hypothetical protein
MGATAAATNGTARANGVPYKPAGNGAASTGHGPDGRFAPGNRCSPGRPPRATEKAYLVAMTEAVSVEDWRLIVARAVTDALRGDGAARQWLASYLIGMPTKEAPTITAAQAAALSGGDDVALARAVLEHIVRRINLERADQAGVLPDLWHLIRSAYGDPPPAADRPAQGEADG